ncbi:MAG TPA: hypothetical protein VLA73_00335 [Burkholderiales bacterium]|nr:hypothetical protein [Burkholderiales bacterium]
MPRTFQLKRISAFAEQLEREGFENQGIESADNLLNDFERGGECISADDVAGLKRLRRLSSKRWAKWFFIDGSGDPTLICVAEWDRP